MHQIRFRWGTAPDQAGGAYSAQNARIDSAEAPPQSQLGELTALPQSLAVLKGPTSKGKKGVERGEGKKKGRRTGGERREGEGKGFAGPVSKCFLRA